MDVASLQIATVYSALSNRSEFNVRSVLSFLERRGLQRNTVLQYYIQLIVTLTILSQLIQIYLFYLTIHSVLRSLHPPNLDTDLTYRISRSIYRSVEIENH